MHDGRDGVEEGQRRPRRSARGSPRPAPARSAGRWRRWSIANRPAAGPRSPRGAISMLRMVLERARDRRRRSHAGPPPARRRPASLCASAARRISEPARRISSCSRPTALFSQSSERKRIGADQFGQAVGLMCASVPRTGRISCSTTRAPASRGLPRRLAAGQAAADDVEIAHGRSDRPCAGRAQPQIGGLRSIHGWACSSWAARRNNVASSP